ncbi:transcriptional regulator, IclR family [Rhizobium sp. RU20A]|uniref:IclR family transcriptional regulator n=1 Tax=Rhizobium sp. RU20A TaxID=1907412 RepID=UPI0009566B37|nr:IclR family transcriptional regulator [Rhizobium sp. RU20A]SIR07791.1 transcriptional regulator, IclR family [Rhizobium sp. RU20A]
MEPVTDETAQPATDTGTFGKVLAVLDLVLSADTPLRFKDVLQLAGQPRGTLHRQLTHLVSEGLLVVGADGSYTPGLRLLRLAHRSWSQNSFRTVAAPHLLRLHAATGETVHLGVLSGSDIVYVDKVEGQQTVRMGSQVGKTSPVYCTGIGKAAIALLPEAELERLLSTIRFVRHTPATLADAAALRAEIATVRQSGIAFDREEHEEGIRCVAAPIRAGGKEPVAAISVTGPAYRISVDQLDRWSEVVSGCAADIARDWRLCLGPGR